MLYEVITHGDQLTEIAKVQDNLTVLSTTEFEFVGRNDDMIIIGA